jgi:hypothetical protein
MASHELASTRRFRRHIRRRGIRGTRVRSTSVGYLDRVSHPHERELRRSGRGASVGAKAIRLVAAGRVSLGVVASVARPAWLEWLFGVSAAAPAPLALARMAGVRDVALGTATLAAARHGNTAAARLALLCGLCDAADAAISVITPGLSRRARTVNVPAATIAAVVGLIAAWHTSARQDGTLGS